MVDQYYVPENHRRVIRALQAGPRAPDRLVRRILEMDAEAAAAPRTALRDRLVLPRLRPAMVAATAALVLAVSLTLTLLLGGPGGPVVVQAAELSLRPATEATPAPRPHQPELLQRSFAGVGFPAWSNEFNWRADGARSDEIDGRETQTVFYRHTHHRIGYTVIAGPTVAPPDDAEQLNVRGVELQRFRLGRQDVVTFERNGRTCVLSGDVHHASTLVKLAAWKGDGAVAF